MASSGQEEAASEGTSSYLRSCISCRRRKVKCERIHPCSSCVKSKIECVFPPKRKRPRLSTSLYDTDVVDRLTELEGVLKSLEKRTRDNSVCRDAAQDTEPKRASTGCQCDKSDRDQLRKRSSQSRVMRSSGRLAAIGDQSLYLSQSSWAFMHNNFKYTSDELDDESSLEAETSSILDKYADNRVDDHNTLPTLPFDLARLRSQSLVLLLTYEENCDPVLKLTHRQTIREMFFRAASDSKRLSNAEKPLVLSIYHAAICTLNDKECQEQYGYSKSKLLPQLHSATEAALRKANYLQKPCLTTLQAFVLLLAMLRCHGDTRVVWNLSGLASHLARSLGVHRDGTKLGLTPFETEMRRRLWWHIRLMDAKFTEDHGVEPSFTDAFYDVQLPLNINDEDISAGINVLPKERSGPTEMTFMLLRFELAREKNIFSIKHCRSQKDDDTLAMSSPADIDRYLNEIKERLEAKYLSPYDETVAIQLKSAGLVRVVIAKLQLIAHQSLLNATDDHQESQSPSLRDKLVSTSVSVLEESLELEENKQTQKWRWLSSTYVNWHAMSFLLQELCKMPAGSGRDRAWRAVQRHYAARFRLDCSKSQSLLWKPLRQLMMEAETVMQLKKQEMFSKSCTWDQGYGLQNSADSMVEYDLKAARCNLAPHLPADCLQQEGHANGKDNLVHPVPGLEEQGFTIPGIECMNDPSWTTDDLVVDAFSMHVQEPNIVDFGLDFSQ